MPRVQDLSRFARWPLTSDLRSLLTALGITLGVELLLAERRFQIFSGAILRARKLDTISEWTSFLAALAAAQALLLLLIFAMFRLRRSGKDAQRRRYDFIFWTSLVFVAAATARYRVLALLSDEAGIQVIRNLGGGSLFGAFAYAFEEGVPIFFAMFVAIAAYVVVRRRVPVGAEGRGAGKAEKPRSTLRARAAAGTVGICAPLLLLIAPGIGDTRLVLERFVGPYALLHLLNAVTDFDRDGYSYFSAHADVAPFDAGRHPFALDVPGNGKDEDGFGGDASVSPPAPQASPAFGETRRHVILIVLESVRADALTRRWGARRVAPNLARLASRGSYSTDVYSHSGFTAGTLKALFTGRIDPPPGSPSLFRDFRTAGYRVGTFSAQVANFGGVSDATGMRANSDVFVDAATLEEERVFDFLRGSTLLVDGRALLREFDRNFGRPQAWRRPNFIYFNFQASHYPYNFPGALRFLPVRPIPRSQISASNAEWVRGNYWDSVAYSDWLVGRVVDRLKRLGIFEDSIVAVVGDHGEQLFENGFLGHGQLLNDVQTRVPLVFNRPGIAIPRPAGHADLRTLLLRLAGARLPEPARRDVFQYVGELDTPSSIALVRANGERTILSLDTEEVSGPAGRGPVRYRALDPRSELGRRVEQLVRRWEAERWSRNSARLEP